MLVFSPPLFSSTPAGWCLEDAVSHSHAHQYIYGGGTETDPTEASQVNVCDPNMAKKLNHNASERDRRKRINGLYSSLRSLLPAGDQPKKLSIPTTVSRVVKYIPELQQQVERLMRKKEELLSAKISRKGDMIHQGKQRNGTAPGSCLSAVSATRLTDREIGVQISTLIKGHETLLSDVLLDLEEDGFLLINSSSSESLGGRVFHNLYFQVEGTERVDCDLLREKLLSLCEKRREAFPSNIIIGSSNLIINGGFL